MQAAAATSSSRTVVAASPARTIRTVVWIPSLLRALRAQNNDINIELSIACLRQSPYAYEGLAYAYTGTNANGVDGMVDAESVLCRDPAALDKELPFVDWWLDVASPQVLIGPDIKAAHLYIEPVPSSVFFAAYDRALQQFHGSMPVYMTMNSFMCLKDWLQMQHMSLRSRDQSIPLSKSENMLYNAIGVCSSARLSYFDNAAFPFATVLVRGSNAAGGYFHANACLGRGNSAARQDYEMVVRLRESSAGRYFHANTCLNYLRGYLSTVDSFCPFFILGASLWHLSLSASQATPAASSSAS